MKMKSLLFVMLLAMGLFLAACGNNEEGNAGENQTGNNDVEENNNEEPVASGDDAEVVGEWSFTVEVIGGETFEFTNQTAEEIGASKIIAQQKDGDNVKDEEEWVGVTLTDFLAHVGLEGYSVIAVENADGDSRELEPSRIDPDKTGFGWMVDGEVLDDKNGPIQLVAHERGPKWWIKNVSYVTVIE